MYNQESYHVQIIITNSDCQLNGDKSFIVESLSMMSRHAVKFLPQCRLRLLSACRSLHRGNRRTNDILKIRPFRKCSNGFWYSFHTRPDMMVSGTNLISSCSPHRYALSGHLFPVNILQLHLKPDPDEFCLADIPFIVNAYSSRVLSQVQVSSMQLATEWNSFADSVKAFRWKTT